MNSFLFSIDVCETEFAKGVWSCYSCFEKKEHFKVRRRDDKSQIFLLNRYKRKER